MCDHLNIQLSKCINIIRKGSTNAQETGLAWLDSFCAEFLKYTTLIDREIYNNKLDGCDKVETVFLCFTQIITCIKQLEQVINAEISSGGTTLSVSREYFLDRLYWCLNKLQTLSLKLFTSSQIEQSKQIEEYSFVELMDMTLSCLSPFCCYVDENVQEGMHGNSEAMKTSQQIRSMINLILSHALAFANVALETDKRALSALCQKLLRECIAFQEECEQSSTPNHCGRKLKSITLENAIYQLEDYINEALLRLVYTCFLDFEKFSIDKLRTLISLGQIDDSALDELIADFDVNLDRTTQIGIFAIAFATNPKVKTVLRSCLASFESLDSCIIPSLQTNSSDIHSEILEQHFNEEVTNFKRALQEIIDSYAFIGCYNEILSEKVKQMEKSFHKIQLQELVQMGEFLVEHFQLKVNAKELRNSEHPERVELFEKFKLMLNECKAILMCANQVEKNRVIKRFKILCSILHKFVESFSDSNEAKLPHNQTQWSHSMSTNDLNDSQRLFESIGISPSICSILYEKGDKYQVQSKDTINLKHASEIRGRNSGSAIEKRNKIEKESKTQRAGERNFNTRCRQGSIRRKESLRTAMFKRQKSDEVQKIQTFYENSTSLQITDILDQLTDLSSKFAQGISQHNETNIL